MAIYPVLFASYLSFILPLGPVGQIAIGVALVWLAGGLNFLGVRPVGTASVILAAILVSPFAILVIVRPPAHRPLQRCRRRRCSAPTVGRARRRD